MSFVIPDGLAPEVYPLAWLVGKWRGTGVIHYPGIPETDFVQDVVFGHDGGPYLTYTSTISLPGEDGQVWSVESGFWRIAPEVPEGLELSEGLRPVEVVVSDASAFSTVYIGATGNGRIDLGSDAIVRTASAPEISGSTRMYGLVHGQLMWAWDLAAFGQELQSYASAALDRVEDATGAPVGEQNPETPENASE